MSIEDVKQEAIQKVGSENIIEKDDVILGKPPGFEGERSKEGGLKHKPSGYPDKVNVNLVYPDPTNPEGQKVVKSEKSVGSLEIKKFGRRKTSQEIAEAAKNTVESEEEDYESNLPTVEDLNEEVEEELQEETNEQQEEEMASKDLVQVWISSSGLDMHANYRAVYVDPDETYMVLFYSPSDTGLILPKKGTELEMKAEDHPPYVCEFSNIDFPITSDLKARIMTIKNSASE